MIIIALVSPTGGAGRTSLAIAAATQLSMLGRNVTLVQADPSNNIEFQLGCASRSTRGLGHVILQGESLEQVMNTSSAGFKLLPFGEVSIAQQLAIDRVLMEQPQRLTELFQKDDFAEDAVVIIDLPRWPAPWCQKVMALSDLNLITLIPDSASI